MPITAFAVIPVGPQQVGGIPEIAFSIPDFEGSTKVQIFANSSKTEIGCFQAVMKNGASLSHPNAVAPILGIFTVVAIVASFLTAAYGVSVTHMRTHYAHSLSIFVVFETFQTIFFSGALSLDWPSVLVAWWSNFAWSAGMIHSPGIAKSVDPFAGVSGNASQVGGAGSVVINNGGGLASQIYGRSLAQVAVAQIRKRAPYNASNPYDYTWAGSPMTPGMPMPGTWVGFPGTLSGVGIAAAGAFLVGLIWLLVAIGLVVLCIVAFKWSLETLVRLKWIKEDRLAFFRIHWLRYLTVTVLRTLFIAFFMIATLALYEFNLEPPAGPLAIAALVLGLFVIVVSGLAFYALHSRLRSGQFTLQADQIVMYHGKLFRIIPCISLTRASTLKEQESATQPLWTVAWFRIRHVDPDIWRPTVHQDQAFVKRFGWLSARYRRTKWWFFAYYVGYQLVRACFVGGAVQNPLVQVYGLLVFEVVAFLIIVTLNPFEGARNTALAVWMLSITKVVTTGLSIAFLPAFNLDRIIATVVGVIIVVVQGFLVIGLLILVVLGAISSWMSLSRNREDFSPESLDTIRLRYYEKMLAKAPDGPRPQREKKEKEEAEPEVAKEPHFEVTSVRRAPKIEDEDEDVITSLEAADPADIRSVSRASRANSLGSRQSVGSLPRAARPHRSSWSSRDFAQWEAQIDRPNSSLAERLTSGSPTGSDASGTTHVANAATRLASRPQSNNSLRVHTPADMRQPSPLNPARSGTPTRDTLMKHIEERISGTLRPPPTTEEE